MEREVLYAKLPLLIRRLFTWGLLASTVFLVIWYTGGAQLWGWFLALILRPFGFLMDIHFDGTSFIYTVPIAMSQSSELAFPINQMNLSMVEVVTLLATWPKEKPKEKLKLVFWCFVLIVAYHLFDLIIQLYRIQIGQDFANRERVFWEPTLWYSFISHVAAFDKFILRFWGGFPVFGLALLCRTWFSNIRAQAGKQKPPRGKKGPSTKTGKKA